MKALKNLIKLLTFVIKKDIMVQLSDFQAQFERLKVAISQIESMNANVASLQKTIADSGMSPEDQATALTNLTAIADILSGLATPPAPATTEEATPAPAPEAATETPAPEAQA